MASIAAHPADIVTDRGRAGFDAAMVLVDVHDGRAVGRGGIGEIGCDLVMQCGLVALEGQQIISPLSVIALATAGLVAMASIVTSAPFKASRSRMARMAEHL
jgi:hypothetical protein